LPFVEGERKRYFVLLAEQYGERLAFHAPTSDHRVSTALGRYDPVLRGAIGMEDEVFVPGAFKDNFGHAPVTDEHLRGLRESFGLESGDAEISCRRRKPEEL
jgi:hypothetical protein